MANEPNYISGWWHNRTEKSKQHNILKWTYLMGYRWMCWGQKEQQRNLKQHSLGLLWVAVLSVVESVLQFSNVCKFLVFKVLSLKATRFFGKWLQVRGKKYIQNDPGTSYCTKKNRKLLKKKLLGSYQKYPGKGTSLMIQWLRIYFSMQKDSGWSPELGN